MPDLIMQLAGHWFRTCFCLTINNPRGIHRAFPKASLVGQPGPVQITLFETAKKNTQYLGMIQAAFAVSLATRRGLWQAHRNKVGKKISTTPSPTMTIPPTGLLKRTYFSPSVEVTAKAAAAKITRSSSMKKKT